MCGVRIVCVAHEHVCQRHIPDPWFLMIFKENICSFLALGQLYHTSIFPFTSFETWEGLEAFFHDQGLILR